jgi:hypothetical protein
MPTGLWHALPIDISPLANHLHLDDQFEQSSLQMLQSTDAAQNVFKTQMTSITTWSLMQAANEKKT